MPVLSEGDKGQAVQNLQEALTRGAYGLWVTQAERDAMAGVLAGCPEEPLPGAGVPPAAGSSPGPVPGPVAYADCSAVRAAGAAPIHRGEPGFSDAFDGDGDGVGCES